MVFTAFGFVTGNGMQRRPAMNRPKAKYLSAFFIQDGYLRLRLRFTGMPKLRQWIASADAPRPH